MHSTVYRQIRRERGRNLAGLGESAVSETVSIADGAFIAPQFNAMEPGTYQMTVLVQGVPMESNQEPYFDLATWNQSIAAAGYSGVTVSAVKFLYNPDANPRSSGGALDIFGMGIPIADFRYQLTLEVAPSGRSGVSGLGVAPWVVTGGVIAAVVAVDLLLYALTGTHVVIEAIKLVGKALGEGVKAASEPILAASIPLLLVGGLALLIFTKLGGRGKYKGFEIGGRS